ncbi:MAG: hypothetical protein AAFV96_08330, partial [Pseudomonadota bacterium]
GDVRGAIGNLQCRGMVEGHGIRDRDAGGGGGADCLRKAPGAGQCGDAGPDRRPLDPRAECGDGSGDLEPRRG